MDEERPMIEYECNCKVVKVIRKKDLPDYPWVTGRPTYCLECHEGIIIRDVSGERE